MITALLIIGGAIALLFKTRRDGVKQGRKDVENEFRASDTRQSDEIRKSVEVAIANSRRDDINNRLRETGGLRDGGNQGGDQGTG